ncbi:MAG: hypothetical protein AB8B79_07745 [Granulosicoccus sp.]
MKLYSLIVVSLSIALAACSEDNPPNTALTPAQQPVNNNPLVVVPAGTVTPTVAAPVNQQPVTSPVTQQPVNDQPAGPVVPGLPSFPALMPVQPVADPVSQTPVNSPGATFSSAQIINGSTSGTAQTFWQCEAFGNTNPDDVFQVAFYADSTASLSFDGQSAGVNWNFSTTGAFLTQPTSGELLDFDNINFVTDTQFESSLGFPGLGGAPIVCNLFSLGGTPSQPGTQTPITQTPVDQASIINATSNAGLENFWTCLLSEGDEVFVFFFESGVGGLIDDTFPEGITLAWDFTAQGVSMTLADGNQILLSTPQFDTDSSFFVDDIVVNGAAAGSMACDLTLAN